MSMGLKYVIVLHGLDPTPAQDYSENLVEHWFTQHSRVP